MYRIVVTKKDGTRHSGKHLIDWDEIMRILDDIDHRDWIVVEKVGSHVLIPTSEVSEIAFLEEVA